MTTLASITLENERLFVTGNLNFATVMLLWNQSLPLIAECQQLHFDFSNVIISNSAGIALMLEWVKLAKKHQKNINFHYIPPQLMSIAAVSGITSLF